MRFTKMQGLANDYIYVDCCREKAPKAEELEELTRRISDRHLGVGSDGLVLILPGDEKTCDFEMRMFNSDGSESAMCGNAARCVGKYVYERGLTEKNEIRLKTGSGIRNLQLTLKDGKVDRVRVDMGQPALEGAAIPTTIREPQIVGWPVACQGLDLRMTCVNMGNPHAVIFVDDPDTFDVHGIGAELERHPYFPKRTNVEFASVIDRGNLRMRVWERGAGETMACGTGACATLVAAVLNGLSDRKATLHLNGGPLTVEWDESTNKVFQEGPAEFVFDGVWG